MVHAPYRFRLAAGTAAFAVLAVPALTSGAHAADPAPTFADVSVHDPSIVTSGDDIWVFGSHAASAHTQDLMTWTQNSSSVGDADAAGLFEDIRTELAATFAWAESSTLWAADVVQLPDGRYAMYYNACEGNSPRSAMGVAISDSVDGPYTDQGIILRSGHRQGETNAHTESGTYNGWTMPNVVDPDAFYDADGKLWMVYGSYSGGIFILEMDEETGLPLEGQGYGKHLIGGNHSRIEGPTIRYDQDSGYYYLYLSFGGLGAAQGYDMRVFRSDNPDGPYVDAEGNLAADVKGTPGTIFDDQAYEPYGVKILGGHVWEAPGTDVVGNVSPGHNSTYEDPETGRTFLVYHSRFPGAGEAHQVRVSQMWLNEAGWPVVSPFRYAGETAGTVTDAEVRGAWQLIDLGKDITAEAATQVDVTFESDGDIVGDLTGTWDLSGANAATLTLDGVDYSGVVVPVWDPQLEEWSTGLTVQSESGVSILGRYRADLTVPEPVTLSDIATNPFTMEIEWLAATGVATGWSNGDGTASFRPLRNVNRDQMAAFLYRMSGSPEFEDPAVPTFADVPVGHVFYTEIEWLATQGITNGWDVDGVKYFRPATAVNRDVMAAFLYRYAGEPEFEGTAQTFVDVPSTHVFYDEIEWLATTGITNGWDVDGVKQFRPTTAVKRDVMAAFLYRYAAM